MRSYSLQITAPNSTTLIRNYTNLVNGAIDLNGLDIEFDLPVSGAAIPVGNGFIRIWGVPLRDLAQTPDLNLKGFKLYGGMAKGLPLANPAQAGLLAAGSILQSFGNWVGTEQTLDLVVAGPTGTPGHPKNFNFDWARGTPLLAAIKTTLMRAYPGYTFSGSCAPGLVSPRDVKGSYSTLNQFAGFIKQMTRTLGGGTYEGLDITLTGQTFVAFDATSPSSPKTIDFKDLMGQPVWLGIGQIAVTTVLRADISVGTFVRLPSTLVSNTAASTVVNTTPSATLFAGSFLVVGVRHLGHLRQPDGNSWSTQLTCAVVATTASVTPVVVATPAASGAAATGVSPPPNAGSLAPLDRRRDLG